MTLTVAVMVSVKGRLCEELQKTGTTKRQKAFLCLSILFPCCGERMPKQCACLSTVKEFSSLFILLPHIFVWSDFLGQGYYISKGLFFVSSATNASFRDCIFHEISFVCFDFLSVLLLLSRNSLNHRLE